MDQSVTSISLISLVLFRLNSSHLVLDLPEGQDPNRLNEDDRIAQREASLQLSSLCKVLTEIRDVSRSANRSINTMQSKITSARDSKLTLILGSNHSLSLTQHPSSTPYSRQYEDLVLSFFERRGRKLPHSAWCFDIS